MTRAATTRDDGFEQTVGRGERIEPTDCMPRTIARISSGRSANTRTESWSACNRRPTGCCVLPRYAARAYSWRRSRTKPATACTSTASPRRWGSVARSFSSCCTPIGTNSSIVNYPILTCADRMPEGWLVYGVVLAMADVRTPGGWNSLLGAPRTGCCGHRRYRPGSGIRGGDTSSPPQEPTR